MNGPYNVMRTDCWLLYIATPCCLVCDRNLCLHIRNRFLSVTWNLTEMQTMFLYSRIRYKHGYRSCLGTAVRPECSNMRFLGHIPYLGGGTAGSLLLFLALQSFLDLSLLYFQNLISRTYFLCGGVVSPTPNPQPGGQGYLFMSGVVAFDLSGMVGPTSSYATTNIPFRILWPRKQHQVGSQNLIFTLKMEAEDSYNL